MAQGPIDPPQLPARLAERYVLEERLADGGSAEVWLAHDPVLDRAVAVKVLHRHLLSDPTMRARLEQEARAAAALSHPGIVTVHDVDVDDTSAAVVLEFVAGESLSDRIRRDGPLPPTEAARIAAEVAEALAHAHERGVIHRDVKPSNVLIEPDGRARLVDFGIAWVMDDAESRLTQTGTIAGTLRYLAPEQLRGETAGPSVDIYGVGIVLAEMLTGRPPYEADNPMALAQAQRNPPPPIVGAPPELADIVRRCLDPDPALRPASAGDLAAELRTWLAGPVDPEARTATYAVVGAAAGLAASETDSPSPTSTTVQAVPVVPVGPTEPVAAVAPAAVTRDPDPLPASRSRSLVWPVLTAVVGLALVAVVVAALVGSSPSEAGVGSSPGAATPTPAPSGEASAAAAPSKGTTAKPPAEPTTVAAAVAAFQDRVDTAESRGAIERKDADDLRRRADDIARKPDGPKKNDVSKKIDDLREKVDDLERMNKIGSGVADAFRAAIDDIDAVANG